MRTSPACVAVVVLGRYSHRPAVPLPLVAPSFLLVLFVPFSCSAHVNAHTPRHANATDPAERRELLKTRTQRIVVAAPSPTCLWRSSRDGSAARTRRRRTAARVAADPRCRWKRAAT
ncbi:hypothetical protein TraAM80_10463, partial [Trypanosoma rangeli]